MGIIRELAKSYKQHDLASLSANISFFAILSFIPLLMIMTSIAGYVLGGSEGLFNSIVSTFTDVLPKGGDEFTDSLHGIISKKSQLGGIGIVVLLFISTLLFSSIERSMDRIFQSVKSRNFFHSKLIAVLFLFGAAFLFFLPTMIRLFEAALARYDISIPLSYIATSRVFFVILAMVLFTAAVIIIPNHRVQPKFAAAGGVLFAVGLGVAKLAFRWYITRAFDRYNLIYGSLTLLVVSVLWVYYLANVLLIASEFVAVLQRRYGMARH